MSQKVTSDNEGEGSSIRRMNESWFNPAADMDDPKFKIGNAFVIYTLFCCLKKYI